MSEANLANLLNGAPLVVCLGPGGVGKTTVSAVLALHKAATGARSLVLTIDPARRLADALNLSGLTNDPVEVPSFSKMHRAGTLSALMLDPTATFDHMIAMMVSDRQRRESLLQNRFYRYMSRSLAGTLEYMAVERLHALSESGQFDAIVLDTPPTTNAIDFLQAPDRIASFFSDRITRWFMPQKKEASSQGWTAKLFKRAGSKAISLLTRVAGDSFVEETVEFFSAFGDLFGKFRARGIEVGKMLRDANAIFVVVCAPDPNRIEEAKAIDAHLKAAGCEARAFIVNRVDEAFLPAETELEDALHLATTLLGGPAERERVKTFIERLEALRKEHQSAAELHAEVVDRVRRYAGKRPVFTAPAVPSSQSPRASLLAMYIGLFADSADAAAELASEQRVSWPTVSPPGLSERRRIS